MGRTAMYLVMMTIIMIAFYFSGFMQKCGSDGLCSDQTPSSALLSLVIHPENLQTTNLWVKVAAAVALIGVAASIFLGWQTGNIQIIAAGPFVTYMMSLGWDFITVFTIVRSYAPEIAILIFGPVMALYVLTMFEFWRGTD